VAALEEALNRREAAKLAATHGEEILRETFAALADADDFPPSGFLWNARHRDVPFHCFLRSRRAPMFRVLAFQALPMMITVEVEHGGGKPQPTLRERFTLRRDRRGQLHIESRRAIR
jgi:aminopeptidase C